MEKYTEQQVEQLAPDNNLKAAKSLLKLNKWPELGYSNRALWGLCQGSGKNPYKVAIDCQNLAFSCSCPSRKFPCKHGLALLLMHSSFDSNFKQVADGVEPDFVQTWLDKRAERAEKKEQKEAAASAKAADPKAQAKRLAARNKKIAEGLDLLEQWLKDVIRNGLAKGLEGKSEIAKSAHEMSLRMTDSQAPGLSKRLARLSDMCQPFNVNEDSYYPILKELSQLYMLVQSYRQVESMPADWQIELKRLIGFNDSREEILAKDGVSDDWLIVDDASSFDENSKLTTHMYIAYGLKSQILTFILVYVPKNTTASEVYMVGEIYSGTMHFYPGVSEQKRALFEPSNTAHVAVSELELKPKAFADFEQLFKAKGQHYATNPFASDFIAYVDNMRFATQGTGSKLRWFLVDAQGHALPLVKPNELDDARKLFIAVTLGHPFTALVKINMSTVDLRSIVYQGKVYVK